MALTCVRKTQIQRHRTHQIYLKFIYSESQENFLQENIYICIVFIGFHSEKIYNFRKTVNFLPHFQRFMHWRSRNMTGTSTNLYSFDGENSFLIFVQISSRYLL